MKFSRFEEIEVWRNARLLVKDIYDLTNNKFFAKDFSFKDQMRRSAISIPSNIAEGYERKSNVEFIRYLFIAKGSSGELRTQLYIANDLGYVDNEKVKNLLDQSESISKSLSGFIKYLQSKI